MGTFLSSYKGTFSKSRDSRIPHWGGPGGGPSAGRDGTGLGRNNQHIAICRMVRPLTKSFIAPYLGGVALMGERGGGLATRGILPGETACALASFLWNW